MQYRAAASTSHTSFLRGRTAAVSGAHTLRLLAFSAAVFGLFWFFRASAYRGDGDLIARFIEAGVWYYKREPLLHFLLVLGSILLSPWHLDGMQVLNLFSCLSGALFFLVLVLLARDWLGDPVSACAVFLASGFAILFAGHTEYYGPAMAAGLFWMERTFRRFRGEVPLWQPLWAYALFASFHLVAVFAAPAVLFTVWRELPSRRGARSAARPSRSITRHPHGEKAGTSAAESSLPAADPSRSITRAAGAEMVSAGNPPRTAADPSRPPKRFASFADPADPVYPGDPEANPGTPSPTIRFIRELAVGFAPLALLALFLWNGPASPTDLTIGDRLVPLHPDPVATGRIAMFSLEHLAGWLFWRVKASPPAIPMLLLFLFPAVRRRVRWGDFERFLVFSAGGLLVFSLIWHPDLGIRRDWDLFAVAALPTTLLGVAAWRAAGPAARRAIWILLIPAAAWTWFSILGDARLGRRGRGALEVPGLEGKLSQINVDGHLRKGPVIHNVLEGIREVRVRNLTDMQTWKGEVEVVPGKTTMVKYPRRSRPKPGATP